MSKKRTAIVTELQSTEHTYVKGLETLMKSFVEPLTADAKKPVLAKDEARSMFSDVPVLLNMHKNWVVLLDQRLSAWSPSQRLGDVLKDLCKFLRLYPSYVNNFNESLATFDRCSKSNARFKQHLDERLFSPECSGKDLPSYLILPIQRIPRYKMLVEELIKNTWRFHCDYEDLAAALAEISQTAIYVNEQKRNAENLRIVMSIENRLVGKKTRNYHRSAPAVHLPRKFHASQQRQFCFVHTFRLKKLEIASEDAKPVVLILFNDAVLYTHQKKKQVDTPGAGQAQTKYHYLGFKSLWLLNKLSIQELADGTPNAASGMLIVTPEETLAVRAASPEAKDLFRKSVLDAQSAWQAHNRARMAHESGKSLERAIEQPSIVVPLPDPDLPTPLSTGRRRGSFVLQPVTLDATGPSDSSHPEEPHSDPDRIVF
eukprot:TRINITY_DN2926_c0_g1_i1.p1 TRINITY_DN2926_c0_g1~~TRINITY_DN2926_c0_g1_i1.p1  ORF type:complete len:494 (-),score=79.06 TRINITY_DN2926_c0_g1_i1:40-1326(-)